MSDTNPPSKPLVMTPGEISQFLADCRTLIAHSRTFYEVRDALSKAVWLIESNMQPVETSTSRDARRYAVISRCVAPKDLYDRLVRDGKSPGEWVDLQREQSIQQKIDELCDAALQRSPEEPTGERRTFTMKEAFGLATTAECPHGVQRGSCGICIPLNGAGEQT